MNGQTNAEANTYGGSGAAYATATTDVTTNQSVTVGPNNTLAASGNVNLTPGNEPNGLFNTTVAGLANAQAYFYGLFSAPKGTGTTDLVSDDTLTINGGAAIKSGHNVTIGAFPGTPKPTAVGRAQYDGGELPQSQNVSTPTSSTSSQVIDNGTITAGVYHQLNITIPAVFGNAGAFVSTLNSNPDAAPFTAVYNPSFDPQSFISNLTNLDPTEAALFKAHTSSTPVGAFTFGTLFAAGGNVTVNADTLTGSGTINAYGGPSITVTNDSPDYLVFGAVDIPDTPGGQVSFTGAAGSASDPGLTVTQTDATTSPGVSIDENYNGQVGTTSTNDGPALFLTGPVTNPRGGVHIGNASGSLVNTSTIDAQLVDIRVPRGVFVDSITPPQPFFAGANPEAEWRNAMIWPGGNPATLVNGPDPNVAVSYVANAEYNSGKTTPPAYLGSGQTITGSYTTPLDLTKAMIGTAGSQWPYNQSAVYFGDSLPYATNTALGDDSPLTASSLTTLASGGTLSGNYHLGTGANRGYFPLIPLETLSAILPSEGSATLSGSGESSIQAGQIAINAQYLDIDGDITAGPPTNWSLNLPASLTAPAAAVYLTGLTTAGSPFINVPDTSLLVPGMSVIGQGIPAGALIEDINTLSATVTLSVAATSSGGTPLQFGFGGALSLDTAAYQHGVVASPFFPIPVSTLSPGDAQITATYNAQTNQITVDNVTAAADGGDITLNGAIISTNPLGHLHVNGGPGQVSVNNQTGVPLVVQNVYAGGNAQAAAPVSTVDITDTAQAAPGQQVPLQTLYVYQPGQGIQVYQGKIGDTLGTGTPSATIAGNSTTYQPLPNARWRWQETASLGRTVNSTKDASGNTIAWSIGPWVWTSGTGNNPWQYVDPATNQPTNQVLGVINPDPTLDNTAFTESITGSSGGFVDSWDKLYQNAQYGFASTDGPGDPGYPSGNGTSDWYYYYPTAASLTLTLSVKADNPITIDFFGAPQGDVSITSDAPVMLDGKITNPDGTTSIRATTGGITTPGGSIVSNNLTLDATGGIGSAGQPLPAALTAGGVLNATAGNQGVFLNLDSGALLGKVAAGDAASGYGNVVLNATGDLEPSGGRVTGNNLTLTSSAGGIGTQSAPLLISTNGTPQGNGSTLGGSLHVSALGDIGLEQDNGDLNIDSVSSISGDVFIDVRRGGIFNSRGQTAASVLSDAQILKVWSNLHLLDPSYATRANPTVAAYQNQVNVNYLQYWELLHNGTVQNGAYTLDSTGAAGVAALQLFRPRTAAYLSTLPATDPRYADRDNPTDAEIEAYAAGVYQATVTFFDLNYNQLYWQLLGNGTVQNGTFTLNDSAVPAFETQAGTTDPAQVKTWASNEYNAIVADQQPDRSWMSRPDFLGFNPTFQYTATDDQVTALTQNSVWTEPVLRYAVDATGLAAVSGTPVGTTTPNVSGRNVILNANGGIGRLAPPVDVTLDALRHADTVLYNNASGGSFTITVTVGGSAETTANIPYNAAAGDVQAALNQLAGVTTSVIGSGTLVDPWIISSTGFTNPSVTDSLTGGTSTLTAGQLTDGQKAALVLATAPGTVFLSGTVGGTPEMVQFGKQPAGFVLTGLHLVQTAPLFVAASGTFKATAGQSVYLQSTGQDLNIDQVQAMGGDASITAPGSIESAGTASPQIITTGNLTLLAGTGNLGTDAGTPLVVSWRGVLDAATAGQNIYLERQGGDLNFNRIVAGGAVQVTVPDGGLYQEIADLPLIASSLTFDVRDGVYEPAGVGGPAVAPLEIQLSGPATLAGTAGQSVNINSVGTPTQGALTLARTSIGGVSIIGLTSIFGDVTLQSSLSILDGIDRSQGDTNADINGNNITLTTGGTAGSTIGTAAANLVIDSALTGAGMLTATTNQDAYLIEKNGDLTLDQVNAPFGTVYLTAPSGSILNGLAGQTSPPSNVIAVKAYFNASGNVGPLNTEVSYLEGRAGSATSDSFTVSNTGPAVVGNVTTDPNAAGVQAGGAVTITTHSPLTITKNVMANQDVQLGGTDHAGENDDLIIQVGVTVQSAGVFSDGSLQSGGNVLIQGGDGVTVQGGATIVAANKVTIQDDSTPAGIPDPDGTDGPLTIAVNGTINAPLTEIDGSALGDIFNLQGALSGDVSLQGGAGNDTITVNPAGILGTLTVDAGGSGNRLIVDDSGNSTTSRIVTVTSSSITGFGTGTINYSASGGSFTDANGNDGISIISSSTQPTTVYVQSTLAGSTTQIQGGYGSTVVVGSLAPQPGGTLANIGGTLSVGNNVSQTVLVLDDSGSATAKQVTLTDQGITGLAPAAIDFDPAQLSTLAVGAGSGGNTFDVSGFKHAAVIDGGTGAGSTLLATKDVAHFSLADNELQTSDGMDVHLAHFTAADLTGGATAGTFDVSGWTGTGKLDGGGGQATVVASDNASFTFADSALDRTGTGRLTLEGIHRADLTDTGGSHTFAVAPSTGTAVTVHGHSPTTTGDTLTLNLAGVPDPVLAETFSPTAGSSGTYTFGGGFQPVGFDGIATLTPDSTDLAITTSASPAAVTAGAAVTYTITATNRGALGVTGVTVTDLFPVGANGFSSVTYTRNFSSPRSGSNTPAAGSGNLNDTVNLAAGDSVTYIVTAVVDPSAVGGMLSNTASVAAPAGVTDNNPANSSASSTVTVTPQTISGNVSAHVQASLSRAPRRRKHGSAGFDYILTIRNNGNAPVQGPLAVVLNGLKRTIRLRGAAGFVGTGKKKTPFVTVPVPGGTLRPGGSVSVTLRFSAKPNGVTPSVFAGTAPQ